MNKLTEEQQAAVNSRGKVIVSASAGSGKTFVMIEKLVGAIAGGADLDEVLAVTFTKKAAAQMREKLRSALIARLDGADKDTVSRLKLQLSKISSADISTIHSLCARLLRTYFYALGIDAGFDIISSDDAAAKELKERAMSTLFERMYDEDNADFKLLLRFYLKKRSDRALKNLVDEAYSRVRSVAHYSELLSSTEKLYTQDGFGRVCGDLHANNAEKFKKLAEAVRRFRTGFRVNKNAAVYDGIFNEMISSLEYAASADIFSYGGTLASTRKPLDSDEDKPAGEEFKKFKDEITKKYKSVCGDLRDGQTEFGYFSESGKIACAFSRVLAEFDKEYAAVKRDENKLDYNDLEHLTLKLLSDDSVKDEIKKKYRYVFVDEYQDVNPVQEEIISVFDGDVFLVGDVKQAIYGFRGSKSRFFGEKYASFMRGDGTALRLSSNFRSADKVINFVNTLFSEIMQKDSCGIDYAADGTMLCGGKYPRNCGEAGIRVFGKEEKPEKELKVYSVREDGRDCRHTREGLAVLTAVEEALKSTYFDLETGEQRDVQAGDICILTRKNGGESAEGILRALTDEGYQVSGAQQINVCTLPEVKQFADILSLIDNARQDMPLVSAMLSPLGEFCEDELAQIRIACDDKKAPFRKCCAGYAEKIPGRLSIKIREFGAKIVKLRELCKILNTGELADEILENYGLETAYEGDKLKNVLRYIDEGADLPLSAFLRKIKAGGNYVPAPVSVTSDSIKMMTMHASKGLEFPVVIIADVCKSFKGADYGEMPFDEEYGFAPRYFDAENMTAGKTVLRRLCKARSDAEELKNEINLFYVACTRAMCKLYILAEEAKESGVATFSDAKCYADLFDVSGYLPAALLPRDEFSARKIADAVIYKPDEELTEKIQKRFMREYGYSESVDLPVKSSASAILKSYDKEPYYAERELFGGEEETTTEKGVAYHRFLELCDFSRNTVKEIEEQILNFVNGGKLTDVQAALLSADELSRILSMPVFAEVAQSELLREQEFLCRLPANEIFRGVAAGDFVLVQGAIDLVARGASRLKIIDYKYSKKTDEELIKTYSPQLSLYKKAAAAITGCSENAVDCTIVNILRKRSISL